MIDMRMISMALAQAEKCVKEGGGPFGTVIVSSSGKIIRARNMVRKTGDPTAHSEVMAVRKAEIDAVGGTMYTSCEPCPMCASAAAWAKIARIYYVISIPDLKDAGSSQQMIRAHDFYKKTGTDIACTQADYRGTDLEGLVKRLLKTVRNRSH